MALRWDRSDILVASGIPSLFSNVWLERHLLLCPRLVRPYASLLNVRRSFLRGLGAIGGERAMCRSQPLGRQAAAWQRFRSRN